MMSRDGLLREGTLQGLGEGDRYRITLFPPVRV